MNLLNFHLLGKSKVLPAPIEKKENSTNSSDNENINLANKTTSFEELLKIKKEELQSENFDSKQIFQGEDTLESSDILAANKKENKELEFDLNNKNNHYQNQNQNQINLSKTNSIDYYNSHSSMVIKNQFLYDYLNKNKDKYTV